MLQDFIKSTIGQVIVVIISLLVLMIALGFLKSKKQYSIKAMVYSAIAIALGTGLSMIHLLKMPQGGSITLFSMLFVVLIGYWFGPVQGILCGITYGILQLVVDPWVVHPVQLILDYPLGFGMLGLSGFFSKKENGLISGYILGVFGRFICSFISGLVFFSMYAPKGFSPVAYSAAYNLAYLGGEAFLTIVILIIPAVNMAINRVKKATVLN